MNKFKRILLSLVLLIALTPLIPVQAGDGVLYIAADHLEGYDRSLFKHWIDADKNGCDTRKEVLIAEALVKPKKGKNCVLTGGKWLSAYDGKTYAKDSGLDIDHLVPLAEAWRSGAWAWTDKERENFANFTEQEWMLNAVTASVNRSKSDRDIANWLPSKNVCQYLRGWVIVKAYFNLTVDAAEAKVIVKNYSTCGLGVITKQSPTPTVQASPSTGLSSLPVPPNPVITYSDVTWYGKTFVLVKMSIKDVLYKDGSYHSGFSISSNSSLAVNPPNAPIQCFRGELTLETQVNAAPGVFLPVGIYNEKYLQVNAPEDLLSCLLVPSLTFKISFKVREVADIFNIGPVRKSDEFEIAASAPMPTSSPTPSPSPVSIVSPGAFCAPSGAIGKSANGTSYTCKTSPTDSRNRWRQ